jgi:hypothetical protein
MFNSIRELNDGVLISFGILLSFLKTDPDRLKLNQKLKNIGTC